MLFRSHTSPLTHTLTLYIPPTHRSQRAASGNTTWYLALAGAFIFIFIGMVIVASKRCNSPASTAPVYNPLDVSTSSAMILDGGSTNHAGGWLDIEGAAAERVKGESLLSSSLFEISMNFFYLRTLLISHFYIF